MKLKTGGWLSEFSFLLFSAVASVIICQPGFAKSRPVCAEYERPVRLTLYETPEKNLISKNWTASSKELAEMQVENKDNYFSVRDAVRFSRLIRDDQDAIYRVRFRYQKIDSSKTKFLKQDGLYVVKIQTSEIESEIMRSEKVSNFLLHDLATQAGLIKIEMEISRLKRGAEGQMPCP